MASQPVATAILPQHRSFVPLTFRPSPDDTKASREASQRSGDITGPLCNETTTKAGSFCCSLTFRTKHPHPRNNCVNQSFKNLGFRKLSSTVLLRCYSVGAGLEEPADPTANTKPTRKPARFAVPPTSKPKIKISVNL